MALAPWIPGTTRLTGLHTLRLKECDRISAPRTELEKLGIAVQEGTDWIEIGECSSEQERAISTAGQRINTYDDHRIAMSMAIMASRIGGIRINDPGCVQKTYPRFWQVLDSCG